MKLEIEVPDDFVIICLRDSATLQIDTIKTMLLHINKETNKNKIAVHQADIQSCKEILYHLNEIISYYGGERINL